jgi:hypothetical protein
MPGTYVRRPFRSTRTGLRITRASVTRRSSGRGSLLREGTPDWSRFIPTAKGPRRCPGRPAVAAPPSGVDDFDQSHELSGRRRSRWDLVLAGVAVGGHSQLAEDELQRVHGEPRVSVAGDPPHPRRQGAGCVTHGGISVCPRCRKHIAIGDDIRYHNDFADPVHVGCREPSARTEPGPTKPKPAALKENPVCPSCWTQHAGPCW